MADENTAVDTDLRGLVRSLALLLDGCLPTLAAAATAEKRREAGKFLRKSTDQRRHERAAELVGQAFDMLGKGRFD